MKEREIEKCLKQYSDNQHSISLFCESVAQFFRSHPRLTATDPVIHSVKHRLKNADHLRAKLRRKAAAGERVEPDAFFQQVTDLAGVRVLHLHQGQYRQIHDVIQEQLQRGDWATLEEPKAYTWDPEARDFFESLGLSTAVKETHYTSVHFVVKPRADAKWCCEIQVRTLFEEIWGEIDHSINYPEPSEILACREQLRVLSKLVGAGSRLADAIFRSHGEAAGQPPARYTHPAVPVIRVADKKATRGGAPARAKRKR